MARLVAALEQQVGEERFLGFLRAYMDAFRFTSLTTEQFNVAVNARQRVDVSLTVGAATESVTVSAAAALVESDSSDR